MTENEIGDIVCGTADQLADALHVPSFASAVDEVLSPFYEDIAAAHEAHAHYTPGSD